MKKGVGINIFFNRIKNILFCYHFIYYSKYISNSFHTKAIFKYNIGTLEREKKIHEKKIIKIF